ncbi:MAG: DciA family protein [Proteobacteria bacterium]|nr:DciA family protein [Pseudomonadota bacterium]
MTEKRLEKLLMLSNNGGLGDIIRHAREMGDLVQALQKALPEDQALAISAANIRDDGTLVVLASSSAWAARLRFESERLMAAARGSGKTVLSCSVRVGRH